MSKKLLAILGLSCFITVLLVACGSSGASAGPNPVHMSGTNFVQNSITIKKGERITLINDDLFGSHTIANGSWDGQIARRAWRTAGQGSADQWLGSRHSWPLHHGRDIPFLLYHPLQDESDRRG